MADVLAVLFATLVGLATALLMLAVMFGITMPFVGTLVRFRATYTPKAGAVRLDAEDGLAARPDAPSYFGMMKRTWRIEGWAGLYKGLMPSVITSLIAVVALVPVTLLVSGDMVLPHGRVHVPAEGSVAMWAITFALSTIPVLLLIPMQILTNRAITTPHTLSAFDAPAALRTLLSPTERANPLRLYLLPGVAPTLLLGALVSPTLSLLWHAALPRLHLAPAALAAVLLPFVLLATALATPLQVLGTRLTLQRRAPYPADALDELSAVGVGEPVVAARTPADGAPYTGLVDAARTVVREEGWGVLARAWWLTALLALVPLLAAPAMLPEVPPTAL